MSIAEIIEQWMASDAPYWKLAAKDLAERLRASDPQKGQGWVSCSKQMPEPSDDIFYELLRDGDDRSFAYYDPAGAKKDGVQSDWCWFDREENAWCHKDRYTHWKLVTPAPPSVPAGPQEEKKK